MKYPYIGKSPQGHHYLVVKKELIYSFLSKSWLFELDGFADLENTTREYLANTYGKVESIEHAEFIVKLAEGAGFVVNGYFTPSWFCINPSALNFKERKENVVNGANACQITIPLPPKESKLPEVNSGTPMPEVKEPKKVSMNDIQVNVKNNTDSVVQVTKSDDESNIFICVSDLPKEPEPKEWPQVGEDVLTASKRKAKLIATHDYHAWVKYYEEDNTFSLGTVTIATLSKPLTPEEDLTSAFVEYEKSDSYGYSWKHLARAIINGEIKGLSYKPE